MSLHGIDADEESFDERSDYTMARRLMDYEIRGTANPEELEWLHAHPIEWLRALRVTKVEVASHIRQSYANLQSDPRRLTASANPKNQQEWINAKAEVERIQISRRTFAGKVQDRIAMVREMLPHDVIPLRHLDTLIPALLGTELALRDGDVLKARQKLASIILKLADEAEVKDES